MSIVKDPSLAPSGLRKIQWVRDFMPALSGIEERFRREKPFQGLTIAVSVHLEAKTANLGLVLREGGADVHLTGCNPLSTQDDVAAAMAQLGVDTFIECGPGKTLCGLIRKTVKGATVLNVQDAETLRAAVEAIKARG